MEDINLIPQAELGQQEQVKAVKLSTVISILFLILVAGVAGYFLYLSYQHNQEMKALDTSIGNLRKEIQANSDVEIKARNLDQKYTALQQIFDKQRRYSLLLKELNARKPATVTIQSFDLSSGKSSVSGLADNYLSISNFISTLVDKNFSGGTPGLESLFTSIVLNSVTMDEAKTQIQFLIVINFDESKLK